MKLETALKSLFIVGVLFSYGVSSYVVNYKLSMENKLQKGIVILLLGAILSILTIYLSVGVIWEPHP